MNSDEAMFRVNNFIESMEIQNKYGPEEPDFNMGQTIEAFRTVQRFAKIGIGIRKMNSVIEQAKKESK